MKKSIIITIVIFISIFLNAQNKNNFDKEQIKSLKVSFLTQKLDLTVKEAQDFWAVFNECQNKIDKLFEEEFQIFNSLKNNESNDILSKTDRIYNIKSERIEIEKEYYEKYKKILPAEKISALFLAEKEFKKHLIQKTNENKEE